MAINPLLLNVKPISEITTVDNPTEGHLLFYDGSDELKKTNVSDFYNAMQSAYLGIATTTTTPPTTGAYWYRVTTAGTYTNFLSGGSPVVVTEGDFYDGTKYYDVTIEVKDNVATKRVNQVNNAEVFQTINSYSVDPEQIVPSEALYNDETLAGDILKRVDKVSGDNVNYREVTTWYDGTPMTDAKLDNDIFIKKGGKYYKKQIDKQTLLKINTIADLRNFNGYYEGQEVVLMGYYEAGDKEPLNYKWTLTQGVDNGSTVINSSKGSWKAVLGDIVDVKHFGAKGDGITDDTLSIKKAIETVKKILFSKGTYNISDVLEITKSGYLIDGDNATIKATSLIFSVFKIYKTIENIGDTTIKNIFIECNNKADYGIHCTDYRYNNIIDAVSVYNSKIHGISLSLNCWINTIQNCRIYYAGSSGIYCGNSANSVGIINNEIGVCNIGIELNASTVSTNGIYLQRNTIQNCINSGISVLGFMHAVSIIGNYMEDNEVYGINTGGNSTGTSIIGNTIHGKTNVSVYLINLNAKTAIVQGNVLINGVTAKIYVSPNAQATILGNRLVDSNSPLVQSYMNDSFVIQTSYEEAPKFNGRRISLQRYSVPPTSGTWDKGDIVYNYDTDVNEPIGWVCTVKTQGSTPAVWKPFGQIGLTKSASVADVSTTPPAQLGAQTVTTIQEAQTAINNLVAMVNEMQANEVELKTKLNAKLTADRNSGQQAT